MIELAADRAKTRFNVTQAFTVGQLGKHHRQELIPARKGFHMVVAVIARDALLEILVGHVIDQLRENGSANVHSYIVPSIEIIAPSREIVFSITISPTEFQIVFVHKSGNRFPYNQLPSSVKFYPDTSDVSAGEGYIDVMSQTDADHYHPSGKIATAAGARTSMFVTEVHKLLPAVPHRGTQEVRDTYL